MLAVLLTVLCRSSLAVPTIHLEDLVLAALHDLLAFPVNKSEARLAHAHLLAVLFAIVASLLVIVVVVTRIALDLSFLVVATFSGGHTLVVDTDKVRFTNTDLIANAI